MNFMNPSHIFRQAQYDFARCLPIAIETEPVEDCAFALNAFLNKIQKYLSLFDSY